MRIALLTAGAGAMYCGSCLLSNTLTGALRRAGEDAVLVPLYTPLRTDEEDLSIARVAFGGVNVYLREQGWLGRAGSRLFGTLLDHRRVLGWAGQRSGTTRPEQLGRLTVSMLRGEDGRQRGELRRLADWLARDVRPDVIHLNNALLVGMARQLRRRLGVPVVASLSGEDSFLEKVPEPFYSEARRLLRQRCGELPALVAMNSCFADFMAGYLDVPRQRVRVVPPGVSLTRKATADGPTAPGAEAAGHAIPHGPPDDGPPVIGFLARVCHDKGLHQLAEAFRLLAADPDVPPPALCAAGYLDPADRPYLQAVEQQLGQAGLGNRFTYFGELDRAGKDAFLRGLDVMCLPTVCRESKGLPVLEAWARGVPAVLPAHGAFPELVEATGGGLLVAPGDPSALAAALKRLLADRAWARKLGRQARDVVFERFDSGTMARGMIDVYREVAAGVA